MKPIRFTQQKLYGWMPLRTGLGYKTEKELEKFTIENMVRWGDAGRFNPHIELCPKIYTTRTHKLSGEYYVVEGSRFKPKPVEPRIEFRVEKSYPFDLKNQLIRGWKTEKSGTVWGSTEILGRDGLSFPELDLGICGSTFEDLKAELLRLNPKATLNTPFWINRIEKMGGNHERNTL